MPDMFVVCSVLKGGSDANRIAALKQLVELVSNDRDNDAHLVSCDANVVVLRFADASKAHRGADVLLGKALAASSTGYPIKPLSLAIHGGTDRSESAIVLGALGLANEIGANEIAITPEAFQRLTVVERDAYRAEEATATRRARRRFATGTDPCFVISPIGEEGSADRERADFVFEEYVKRGCADLGFRPFRSDQEFSRAVRRDLMNSITRAKLVLAYLGKPPWNPNVMIEIGYRLAAGGALVLFRDAKADYPPEQEERLPFDIDDVQVLSLPPLTARDDTAQRDNAVASLASAITQALAGVTAPNTSRHPFMQIEIDRRRVEKPENVVREANREAQDLFAREGTLVGANPNDVVMKLKDFMPVGQFMAFATEQTGLIQDLMTIPGAIFGTTDTRKSYLNAMVPMVFERHPNPKYDQRAFLPIIVHSDNSRDDKLVLNVLYLDVTSATRVKDGVFKCILEGEERSALTWDNYAVSYDKILTRLSIYRTVLERHVSAMSKEQIRTVLDVGSGTGNATIPLLKMGKHVTVVERSAGMLDLMRHKVLELDAPLLSTYEQSAQKLPFATERFDGVTILLALFAMERPRAALNEALRVLKSGGQLVLTEPKRTFKLAPLLEFAEDELRRSGELEDLADDWQRVASVNQRIDPGARPRLPVEEILTLLGDRGFSDIRIEDSHLGNCQTVWARKP